MTHTRYAWAGAKVIAVSITDTLAATLVWDPIHQKYRNDEDRSHWSVEQIAQHGGRVTVVRR